MVLDNTSYDADSDLVTQIATIAGTGNVANNTYAYDNLDNLVSVSQTASGVASKRVVFGVNQIGQTTSIDRQVNNKSVLNTYRTYQYDNTGALTSINYASGSRAEYAIGRDQKERITQLTIDHGTTRNYTYFYDDELKTAPGQTLDYDPNSNRTTGGCIPGKDNRLEQDNLYTYQYDKEGNLTRRITRASDDYIEFSYDYRNRLIGAAFYGLGGFTLTKSIGYDYDAADRMIHRIAGGSDASDQRFAYDGSDVIFTFNAASVTAAAMVSRYLYGAGEHQVLAEDTPGNPTAAGSITRWQMADYEGSIRKVIDDEGHLISSLDYDAFGNVTAHTGTELPSHQYTGQWSDTETGFSNYGARWYDPGTGRFLGQDPAGEGTNPYDYVGNDPMDATDPTGMTAFNAQGSSGWGLSAPASQPAPWEIQEESERQRIHTQALADSADQEAKFNRDIADSLALVHAARAQMAANQYSRLGVYDKADLMTSDERRIYLTQMLGPDAAADYRQSLSDGYGRWAYESTVAGGYNKHPEWYEPSAFEQNVMGPIWSAAGSAANSALASTGVGLASIGVGTGDLGDYVLSSEGMDVMDEARPALTDAADVLSFVPGVNAFAIPAAMTLHAANDYAAGASWGDIGEHALTEAAPQVLLWGTGKVFKYAMGGTVAPVSVRGASEPAPRSTSLTVLSNCFVAGTPVLMADGSTKPIEDVEEGDLVMADDPGDGLPAAPHEVTAWHLNWTEHLIDVSVDADGDSKADGSVEATREHPFWTENRGWVDAQDLHAGDLLLDASGHVSHVTTTKSIDATEPVFNLSVESVHTFFVMAGNEPVLVHNTNAGPKTFLTYMAPDANGVWYAGRASIQGTFTGPDDWRTVLNTRYSGEKNVYGLDFSKAKRVFSGTGIGPYSAAGMASRGFERLAYNNIVETYGQALNKNVPLNGNPRIKEYLAMAKQLSATPCL